MQFLWSRIHAALVCSLINLFCLSFFSANPLGDLWIFGHVFSMISYVKNFMNYEFKASFDIVSLSIFAGAYFMGVWDLLIKDVINKEIVLIIGNFWGWLFWRVGQRIIWWDTQKLMDKNTSSRYWWGLGKETLCLDHIFPKAFNLYVNSFTYAH